MVQSLEQYVAQATQAYQPAKTAVQTQLNSLSGNLQTATDTINRNYAQQQAGLNRDRNMAAETASMQAAGSGGSFGGSANLANRKYYDQTFVPAVTKMRTNQTNELSQAQQNFENQRTNLNAQLANLDSQANQQALQQYWADVEAEKAREAQLRAQREAQAAANAQYQYMMDAMKNQNQTQSSTPTFEQWVSGTNKLNTSQKNTILNGLNSVAKQSSKLNPNGILGKTYNTGISNAIQNSAVYKQYLKEIGR